MEGWDLPETKPGWWEVAGVLLPQTALPACLPVGITEGKVPARPTVLARGGDGHQALVGEGETTTLPKKLGQEWMELAKQKTGRDEAQTEDGGVCDPVSDLGLPVPGSAAPTRLAN